MSLGRKTESKVKSLKYFSLPAHYGAQPAVAKTYQTETIIN